MKKFIKNQIVKNTYGEYLEVMFQIENTVYFYDGSHSHATKVFAV